MELSVSSEVTFEDDACSASDAFEESTTQDERALVRSLPSLPTDAWALIVRDLSIWDVAACLQVCRGWHAALVNDKIWRLLCGRYGVPPPPEKVPATFSFVVHFREHAKSIVGPTLNFRQTPSIEKMVLPGQVAHSIEAVYEERRCSAMMAGQDALLMVDELGVQVQQLLPPFRCSRVPFEVGEDGVTPVQHRRAWTDGVHVLAQTAYRSKAQPMAIKIFQITIKPKATGVSLLLLGDVSLGTHAIPDYPYLMNAFFAKTFFILEFAESSLRTSVLYRVELHNRTATAMAKFPGLSLGSGSASGEERMSSIAFHNWQTFVLRKFPDEQKPEKRAKMFVYSHKLELLHEYGAPMGENWRYPFFVKVFDQYCMLAYYLKEHAEWAVYKTGGPVLMCIWKRTLPQSYIARQIACGVFDQAGVSMAFIQEHKKRTDIVLAFYPFDDALLPRNVVRARKDEHGPRYAWKHVLKSVDFPFSDPTKVRCWSGQGGAFLVLFSPYGGTVPSPHHAELTLYRFVAPHGGGMVRRARPVEAAGAEMLQKELLQLSESLSVDQLMALVAQTKQLTQNPK